MTRPLATCLALLAASLAASDAHAADDYQHGPDSMRTDGVPVGTVTKHQWTSKIFTGTVRDQGGAVTPGGRLGRRVSRLSPWMKFLVGLAEAIR